MMQPPPGQRDHPTDNSLSEKPAIDSDKNTASLFKQTTHSRRLPGLRYFLLVWPLFFLICCGLGYPTLRRYDPRLTEGLSDAPKYYALTTGAERPAFNQFFRGRVLVPYVAKPFYWFAQSHLTPWNPVSFGLLISNSLFCATTVCFLIVIGNRMFNDLSMALLGGTLYLLNFAIPNLQLSGLIDAGESCFMAAVVWTLLTNKWYLLPIWGVFGALAKETFVPFSGVFVFTWWLVEGRQGKLNWSRLKWIAALGIIGLATVVAVQSVIAGHFEWPWEIAHQAGADVNFLAALWKCVSERSFWYVFGWLIPLGIWRLKCFPSPWLVASAATGVVALILGAFSNAGGTIGRSVFDIMGPLLSLSVVLLIAKPGSFTRSELAEHSTG